MIEIPMARDYLRIGRNRVLKEIKIFHLKQFEMESLEDECP